MQDQFNERQQEIIELLKKKGEVKIAWLSECFRVTEMTVRRDLEKLERAGQLRRTFGGAILASHDVTLQERVVVRAAEKERIGQFAAGLIRSGDSIFIDGGSTTLQLARFLPEGLDITIVTNAINVAAELSEKKIPTIVLGGTLLDTTKSMVGHMTVEAVSRMAFDKVFLGATGVHPTHGFSNSNMNEAEVKRAAIRQAKESYVVMDHTKFGASTLVSFASLAEVRALVTDHEPEQELAQACRTAGLMLLTAPSAI
jgi:DeoR family transcriptional regulator, fructose operon transcriptional repressor